MKKLLFLPMLAALAPGCSSPSGTHNHMPGRETRPQARVARKGARQAQQNATIDPRSTRAASDLVQGFIDLLNRREFDEAYMLLGPGAPPRSEFDRQFSRLSDLHVSVGTAGEQQGAAGSIYVSVPLTISGSAGRSRVTRSATAILRRVNDVPGSTDAQRRWHIEGIDWSRHG